MSEQNKSIHEKMTELNQLVGWFESDEFVIEEAMKRFEDAEALSQEIEQDIAKIKNRVTVLKKKFDQE